MAAAAWGIEIDGGFFFEPEHRYRCKQGHIRPSATQVFSLLGLTDFSGIAPRVLEWKRTYGSALHKAAQYLAQGDLNWDTLDDPLIPAITGIECWLKVNGVETEEVEETKIRSICGMSFGTQLDLRGTLMYHGQRRHCLIDYKSGSRESPTWRWQLGAYYADQPKVAGGWLGVILRVDMDGNVKPFWCLDLDRARSEFQVLLAAAIIGINSGIYKL